MKTRNSTLGILIICLLFFGIVSVNAQEVNVDYEPEVKTYPHAKVDYDDFEELVAKVKPIRAQRLLSLDSFLAMSASPEVIILDTRSDEAYMQIHVRGAKHLDFSEFSQDNLAKIIPNPNTIVLIYCNNNFDGNEQYLFDKFAGPPRSANEEGSSPAEKRIQAETKPIMLALNIPTYITLYGYGYRNIYELDEYVNVKDPRIRFEGLAVE